MDDELTGLLAAGERAAFHGRPAAGVGPLQRAVELAHGTGREAEATAAAWLLGVCLGAGGLYGSAMPCSSRSRRPARPRPIVGCSPPSPPPPSASLHRQLGRHEDARAWTTGPGPRGRMRRGPFDAALGLAADALGLGEPTRPQRSPRRPQLADRPQRLVASAGPPRLGARRARAADRAPAGRRRRAAGRVALAESSGAPRHVAKGTLFDRRGSSRSGDLESATVQPAAGRRPGREPWRGTAGLAAHARCSARSWRCRPPPREPGRSPPRGSRTPDRRGPPEPYAGDWLARPDIAALIAGPAAAAGPVRRAPEPRRSGGPRDARRQCVK